MDTPQKMDTVHHKEVNSFFSYAVIRVAWWTGLQVGGVRFWVGFGGCFPSGEKERHVWNS